VREVRKRLIRKRRWGYFVWVIAGVVIAVPEITAGFDGDALPFTTISGMVGHLEFLWNPTELFVIAAIVFVVFSTMRKPPPKPRSNDLDKDADVSVAAPAEPAPAPGQGAEPQRTPGGRLTLNPPAAAAYSVATFDEEGAPLLFAFIAAGSLAAVALATWAAVHWWDDQRHFHPAYVLYGLLGLLWLLIPSVVAFLWGKDAPYPTLFRTVSNLEEWLSSRPWELRARRVGPALAWLVSFVILWGFVVLLLHLTLYPFPNITHILNPRG
jgi:hypothetical protein